jgi:hypothetical protein
VIANPLLNAALGVDVGFFDVLRIVFYVAGAIVLLVFAVFCVGWLFSGLWRLVDWWMTRDWRSAETIEREKKEAEENADARKCFDYWNQMNREGTPLPVTWLFGTG